MFTFISKARVDTAIILPNYITHLCNQYSIKLTVSYVTHVTSRVLQSFNMCEDVHYFVYFLTF